MGDRQFTLASGVICILGPKEVISLIYLCDLLFKLISNISR
jgi:hypothetical protein